MHYRQIIESKTKPWVKLILITAMLLNAVSLSAQNNNTIQDLLLQKIIYKDRYTKVQDNVEVNFTFGRPYWVTLSNELRLETPRALFTPLAALYTSYVIQEHNINYFEVRPWMGGKLNINLNKDLRLYEFTKVEMRSFHYIKEIPRETYGRLRAKLGAALFIIRNDVKNTAWSIDASYEWFFLQAPAVDEQYSNSRILSLRLIRHFANNNTLLFKLNRNRYILGNNNHEDAGTSLTLEYDFW